MDRAIQSIFQKSQMWPIGCRKTLKPCHCDPQCKDQLIPYDGILPPRNWTPLDTSADVDSVPLDFNAREEVEETVFNLIPSPEPPKKSRWGSTIKPPVIYSP